MFNGYWSDKNQSSDISQNLEHAVTREPSNFHAHQQALENEKIVARTGWTVGGYVGEKLKGFMNSSRFGGAKKLRNAAIGGTLLLLGAYGCGKDNGGGSTGANPDPKMTLVAPTGPSSVDLNTAFDVRYAGEDADTPTVDGLFSVADSAATVQIPTDQNGDWSYTFTVLPGQVQEPGTLSVKGTFRDDDQTLSRTYNVDIQGPENTPATFDFTPQDNLYTNTDIQFDLDIQEPDGLFKAALVENETDTTWYNNLSGTTLTDVITRRFDSAQEFNAELIAFGQNDVTESENFSFDIQNAPTNTPSNISITANGDFVTGNSILYTIGSDDVESIDRVVIKESPTDSLVFDNLSVDDFSTEFSRTYDTPQDVTLTVRVTDGENDVTTKTQTYSIRSPSDQLADIDITAGSGRGSQNWSATVNSPDGLESAEFLYVQEGRTDTTRTLMNISGNQANLSLNSPSTPADYVTSVVIKDLQGNTQRAQESARVLAQLQDRTITVDTPYENISVTGNFDFNGQNANAQTDANGNANFSFTGVQDSSIVYTVTADALGLEEAVKNGSSTANTSVTLNPTAVPINFTQTQFEDLRPRSEQTVDISEYVSATDNGQNVPLEIELTYDGNNLVVQRINENQYEIGTSTQDPSGITEELNLHASHRFADAQQTVDQRVTQRADIVYSQNSFDGRERQEKTLDLQDIVSSAADITQVVLQNASAGLALANLGNSNWSIQTTDNISTPQTYTFDIVASNAEGNTETATATFYVDPLPNANITAINSVTDQPVESYLLFRDANDAVIDSVSSLSGNFNVEIPSNATAVAVAEHENGTVISFEHYWPINATQDLTKTLAVEDFREYDIDRQYVGNMSLFDMKRFKHLVELVHGQAPVLNLNGGRDPGGWGGKLHRATESLTGIGYDKLVVPDTTNWVSFGEIGIMEIGTPELIQNEYETKIAPIMGDFAPPVERKNRIVYINDEQVPNVAYINPRLLPDSFGSIVVFGEKPYTNQQSLAQILSDGQRKVLSDDAKKTTTLQELTNGMIYFSQLEADFGGSDGIPSKYQLGPTESIIHNSTTLLDLSKFDKKAGWMIYEPHHVPGEKLDHILWVPAQVKAEYDSQ